MSPQQQLLNSKRRVPRRIFLAIEVLDELARQLSAFTNSGGDQIVYGVVDSGAVGDNGGIARCVKGRQSTKEWNEDVVPSVTGFEILGFNVYEIPPIRTGSKTATDKSIYVIDVPECDRAPHRSNRDLKYYVRLSGNTRATLRCASPLQEPFTWHIVVALWTKSICSLQNPPTARHGSNPGAKPRTGLRQRTQR